MAEGDADLERAAVRWLTGVGGGVLVAVVALLVAGILIHDGGVFSYTLDDPYVHLELARNLGLGHHGVEPGAFSAPSSSILWPLLLVPAWWIPGALYVPLVLGLLAGLGAVAGLAAATGRLLGPLVAQRRGVALALVLLGMLAVDLPALVCSGMEHTLQVALTVWLGVGWIDADRQGRPPGWLVPVAVVLPLVRLEDTGLALLTAALLAWRGRAAWGAAVVAGVVGTLAPYLGWLHARSGFWLPFSILSKRDMFPTAIHELGEPSVFLPLLLAAFLVARATDGAGRAYALAVAAAVLGHDLLGQVGLFHRYVAYVVAFVVVVGGWTQREAVRRGLREGGSSGRVVLWIAAMLAMTNAKVTYDVVGAAGHIWRMQGQLRRLAVEVVDGPVAVNDIGWVSLDNDREVVDLVGLASADALRHRLAKDPVDWMDGLVHERGVRLVMVYAHWFPVLPDRWVSLGTLVVDDSPFAEPDRQVTLLAPDAASAPALRSALKDFAKSMPEGVRIVLRR